jgi:hypothetical protein
MTAVLKLPLPPVEATLVLRMGVDSFDVCLLHRNAAPEKPFPV